MVKIIEYVQCDCEKGKLELIASTQQAGSIYVSDSKGSRECGTFRATHFYGCSQCDAVYKVHSEHPSISWEDIFLKHLVNYKGSLTREEIKQSASKCHGEIRPEDEERIIKKRSETK